MAHVSPQPTPNPQAFKFTIEGHSFDAPISLNDADAAQGTPFEAVMKLPGVAGVFATANFVTVTKAPASDWEQLVPVVKETLEQSF